MLAYTMMGNKSQVFLDLKAVFRFKKNSEEKNGTDKKSNVILFCVAEKVENRSENKFKKPISLVLLVPAWRKQNKSISAFLIWAEIESRKTSLRTKIFSWTEKQPLRDANQYFYEWPLVHWNGKNVLIALTAISKNTF